MCFVITEIPSTDFEKKMSLPLFTFLDKSTWNKSTSNNHSNQRKVNSHDT